MLEAYTVEDEIQLHKFSSGLSGILTPRNPCVHMCKKQKIGVQVENTTEVKAETVVLQGLKSPARTLPWQRLFQLYTPSSQTAPLSAVNRQRVGEETKMRTRPSGH